MKRRHSSDEFCSEECLRAKRIRREENDEGVCSLQASTVLSSDPQSTLCNTANPSQCNKESTHKSIIARAFAIAEEMTDSESDVVSYAPYEQEFLGDTNVAYEQQQHWQGFNWDSAEDNNNAYILSTQVLNGLNSTYTVAEMSPEVPSFQLISEGSSIMGLAEPQNHVYISVVPQTGEVTQSNSQMFSTVESVANKVSQPTDNYSQYTTKSFSDKMKERLENWYYETMDVDRRETHKLRYPSHLLEWSERVKFRHERRFQLLEYHAPDYSTFD
ncbi:uncharacterized protein LOC111137490 isoform X1 [Crassostrea virginica]